MKSIKNPVPTERNTTLMGLSTAHLHSQLMEYVCAHLYKHSYAPHINLKR